MGGEVTGKTRSADFPIASPLQANLGGGLCNFEPSDETFERIPRPCYDAFITKLNPMGNAIYSTYLGGNENDVGNGIAADAAGNAYVTGATGSVNFPTARPIQAAFSGGQCSDGERVWPCPDIFITKLNPTGSALLYSTYLGGRGADGRFEGIDIGRAITVDASGNAYVTGQTASLNFPVTFGTFQPACRPSVDSCQDAFVTKVNVAGSEWVYSTFLGGTGRDRGLGIAVDSSGNAIVTGFTDSSDFPVADPISASLGGEGDAFVTKLNAAGSGLIYSTYLGGSSQDRGHGVAVDSFSNAYVTGSTASTNFPTVNPFQAALRGSSDAFVAKIAVTSSSGDSFDRPDSTHLGPDWNEYQPDLEIFNHQVRNIDTGSKAALFHRAIGPDQDVLVDCMMTAPRNSCAVMARWSNGSNFYRARLDAGAQDFKIFKTVNGTTTLLGSARRVLQFNTFYRIRLLVQGTSLQAFFGNETAPAISVTDASLRTGDFAGIRSFNAAVHTTWFDNFAVSSVGAEPFNQPPTARISADPTSGTVPLTVHFDGAASTDPDGAIISYAWNFGDGATGSGPVVDHTYTSAGTFTATLTVTDNGGATGSAQTTTSVTSGTSILFNDEFNRTTGLGTNWRITAGRFRTDGNFAISGGTANAAAITQSLGTNDYTVETVMIIPPGSQFSGIIARGEPPPGFTANVYSAQLHTNGSVNLYRRNAGAWKLLQSAPAGIVANTPFTLALRVSGSTPVLLEVFLNGRFLFSFTDSSPSRIPSGIPGLINYHPGVRYDRFAVFTP